MLVIRGDEVLLGRQPTWPANRYSALAGFVSPGEAIEEAVLREVEEESRHPRPESAVRRLAAAGRSRPR